MRLTTLRRTWPLAAIATAFLAVPSAVTASEECCNEAGEIAECWWQDAKVDNVFCTSGAQCPSGICDRSFGLGRGLCTCPGGQGQCERVGAPVMEGVCATVDGRASRCGPSYCNGYSVCECYGGCVPIEFPGGYTSPDAMCGANSLNCCEGTYSTSSSGNYRGYCSPDPSCGTCDDDGDCDDGNPCTVGERCVADQCTIGTPLDCDDGSACTTDMCDPTSILPDPCLHAIIPCVDADNCTVDACNPLTGCTYAPKNCNDANACSVDSCNARDVRRRQRLHHRCMQRQLPRRERQPRPGSHADWMQYRHRVRLLLLPGQRRHGYQRVQVYD
ncbi:MAG: hypothetical protein MUC50_07325 [Myxococcota bacterium]|nr:hypothetical protein [Myxococcota bacterium]